MLVKPGKKARPGDRIVFGEGRLTAEVLDVVEDGNRLIRFYYDGVFELPIMPTLRQVMNFLQSSLRRRTEEISR